MRVIGLDPGLRCTGWGVIDVDGSRLRHVGNGVVRSDAKRDLAERLVQLHQGLAGVIETYSPVEAAVEASLVNKNPGSSLKLGVARGAIESCAENLADGVIGPVFWYVLLGLPGLVASKMVNTLDSMIGHRSPRYRVFGAAAARLDDAVNFVPARLTGAIVALAAALAPRAKGSPGFLPLAFPFSLIRRFTLEPRAPFS